MTQPIGLFFILKAQISLKDKTQEMTPRSSRQIYHMASEVHTRFILPSLVFNGPYVLLKDVQPLEDFSLMTPPSECTQQLAVAVKVVAPLTFCRFSAATE